jgi:3-dehydroquinate synthetase
LHGEAVAWGMIASTMIAVGLQMTSSFAKHFETPRTRQEDDR